MEKQVTDQPKMLVWDKQSQTWKRIAFNTEFGLRGVRETAKLLRDNGIPACAVTRRMEIVQ